MEKRKRSALFSCQLTAEW
jgi:ATP-dependent RNA helicase DDX23/PRP28